MKRTSIPKGITLIHRSTHVLERSRSNHKRALRRLRNKHSAEGVKEERAALKQLMELNFATGSITFRQWNTFGFCEAS